MRVERYDLVEAGGAQVGDGVSAHGQQQEAEGKGHSSRCPASHADPVAHQQAQAALLSLDSVIYVTNTSRSR